MDTDIRSIILYEINRKYLFEILCKKWLEDDNCYAREVIKIIDELKDVLLTKDKFKIKIYFKDFIKDYDVIDYLIDGLDFEILTSETSTTLNADDIYYYTYNNFNDCKYKLSDIFSTLLSDNIDAIILIIALTCLKQFKSLDKFEIVNFSVPKDCVDIDIDYKPQFDNKVLDYLRFINDHFKELDVKTIRYQYSWR